MENQKSLAETLADIKSSKKSPVMQLHWKDLHLDGPIRRLKASLILNFTALPILLLSIFPTTSPQSGQVVAFLAVISILYMIWNAFSIQTTLHFAGLGGHSGWALILGILVINPFIACLYIPISVYSSGQYTREKLHQQMVNTR